jgi:gliding motility-associated-like protein
MLLVYSLVKIFHLVIALIVSDATSFGQNSFVEQGFGGRLWYRPTNFVAGEYSAYAICGNERKLYSWGDNYYGPIGKDSVKTTPFPVEVESLKHVRFCSASRLVGAITEDGSGWIWGGGYNSTPVKVIEDVIYCDAGSNLVVFVKGDQTVWSVGRNWNGSFGNGQYTETNADFISEPTKMNGVNNAVRVANGYYTSIILLENGEVLSVGLNRSLGLGYEVEGKYQLLAKRIPTLENIVDVKAFGGQNIALSQEGFVYHWGHGVGSIPKRIDELSNIVAISSTTNGQHVLALDSLGNCYSWGHNLYGQQGLDGHSEANYRDTALMVATDVIDIMAGGSFSYIVKKDLTMYSAGASMNRFGPSSLFMGLDVDRSKTFIQVDPLEEPMNLCMNFYYKWSSLEFTLCPDSSIELNGSKYSSSGIFYDTTVLPNGYDSFTQVNIKQLASCNTSISISIPTAFSPNNDGLNDQFRPIGQGFETQQIRIYNRWGQQIYSGKSSWDGTNQYHQLSPQGVYTYFLETRTVHGTSKRYSGKIKLLR